MISRDLEEELGDVEPSCNKPKQMTTFNFQVSYLASDGSSFPIA